MIKNSLPNCINESDDGDDSGVGFCVDGGSGGDFSLVLRLSTNVPLPFP